MWAKELLTTPDTFTMVAEYSEVHLQVSQCRRYYIYIYICNAMMRLPTSEQRGGDSALGPWGCRIPTLLDTLKMIEWTISHES